MNQRHLRHLNQAIIKRDSIVTIGVFDGVHRGHQALIRPLIASARQRDLLAAAVTFFPHPDKALRQVEQRYYLTSPEARANLLLSLGFDLVITHPFDAATRQLSAKSFVDMLLRHLQMRELWVGSNFALGYQREGTVDFLRARGQESGFRVVCFDLLTEARAGVISSSQLRDLLRQGNMQAAAALLGRDFSLRGKVVRGAGRGKTIGVPTANLEVWDELVIPPKGVYAGFASLDGERFMAAINIGDKPTFGANSQTIEAHLLDFDRDFYGATLELSFVARLRQERKFDGVDALVAQIKRDIQRARDLLQGAQPD